MKRREALRAAVAFAGFAALCAGPGALAQAVRNAPGIALVDSAENPANMAEGRHPHWGSLLGELRRLGYAEGKSIAVERWSGGGDTGGYVELTQKVAASKPRVVVARGRALTSALAAQTSDTPIVSVGTISPDLRASLARPGGNVTGLCTSGDDQMIYSKQLDFLGALIRANARVAWLGPQLLWDGPTGAAARQGAKERNLMLHPVFVSSPVNAATIERAFVAIGNGKFDGLLVSPATEMFPHRATIARLALDARLPTISTGVHFVEAGLLAGYGAVTEELYRRAAHYVDKILNGAKPGDLPIEQPTKIHLAFNRKTAKSLGVIIRQQLLMRADRVFD